MSNATCARRILSTTTATLVLAAAAIAHAQPAAPPAEVPPPPPASGNTTTSAEAAFNRGMNHMRNGQFHLACPEFESSLALTPDITTHFRLAECYQETGRVGSAWNTFNEVAIQAAKRVETVKANLARTRAQALLPRLSRLRVAVPPSLVATPNISIHVDSRLLTRNEWGQPLVVDKGKHAITVTAPGRQPWSQEVELAEGEVVDVALPPPRVAAASPDGGGYPGLELPPPPPIVDGRSWPERHVASLITAGAGAAMALAGIGVGVVTYNQYEGLAQTCAGTALGCSQDEIDAVSTKATVSNVLFGLAGAAGVAAVVVYFVEGDAAEEVAVAVGPAGVFVGGRF